MENAIIERFSIKPAMANLLFRIGLSSFFLINSLAAWFAPNEFLELLGGNALASAIAVPQFWVYVIGINDGLLFLLILSGRWNKKIAVWAGLWVFAVIYVTISEGTAELIEHIGVLSFILYYFFMPQNTSTRQNNLN